MALDVAAIAQAELDARLELHRRILAIIYARCETGYARVHRGALHAYVYNALGLHGPPSAPFVKIMHQVVAGAGYRPSYLHGQRCYYGLGWKGEAAEDWCTPRALDIPRWIDVRRKFALVAPEEAHVPAHRPAGLGWHNWNTAPG